MFSASMLVFKCGWKLNMTISKEESPLPNASFHVDFWVSRFFETSIAKAPEYGWKIGSDCLLLGLPVFLKRFKVQFAKNRQQ